MFNSYVCRMHPPAPSPSIIQSPHELPILHLSGGGIGSGGGGRGSALGSRLVLSSGLVLGSGLVLSSWLGIGSRLGIGSGLLGRLFGGGFGGILLLGLGLLLGEGGSNGGEGLAFANGVVHGTCTLPHRLEVRSVTSSAETHGHQEHLGLAVIGGIVGSDPAPGLVGAVVHGQFNVGDVKVGTDLKGLLLAHEETNLAVLVVLQELDVTATTLNPGLGGVVKAVDGATPVRRGREGGEREEV